MLLAGAACSAPERADRNGYPEATRQSESREIAAGPPMPTEPVRYDDVGPLPGSTKAIDLSTPVVVTATGTAIVRLGPRPDAATGARVSVVCLTAGEIRYPDGASVVCEGPASKSEIAKPRSANYAWLDLDAGQTALRFQASDNVGWRVVTNYVRTEMSKWGVNGKSETFGVQRDGKSLDLIAVYATNGHRGYAYVKDLDVPPPTSPADALTQEDRSRTVPVYESDGETVIGEFTSGP